MLKDVDFQMTSVSNETDMNIFAVIIIQLLFMYFQMTVFLLGSWPFARSDYILPSIFLTLIPLTSTQLPKQETLMSSCTPPAKEQPVNAHNSSS